VGDMAKRLGRCDLSFELKASFFNANFRFGALQRNTFDVFL
jgi:hypothetical protein